MPTTTSDSSTEQLRKQAIERLEARSGFWSHLAAYTLVSAVLVLAWFMVTDGGLFWPVFPMLGWGIGLFFHAVETFRRPYSEDRIRREIDRLR